MDVTAEPPRPKHAGGRPPVFVGDMRSQYLACLRMGLGRAAAARTVGISPRQAAAVRAADADWRKRCEEAEDEANEPVERQLYEAAARGEPWAVKMWLTNRSTGGRWQEKPTQVQVQVSGGVDFRHGVSGVLEDVVRLQAALAERQVALEAGPIAEVGPGLDPTDVLDAEILDG